MENDEKTVDIEFDVESDDQQSAQQDNHPSEKSEKKIEGIVAGIVKRYLKDQVPKQQIDENLKRDVEELKIERLKRQFAYENNLSPQETDMVFKVNPNPTKEDLDNPFVKGGIEAIRKEKRVDEATPAPSSSASVLIEGKEFKDLSEEDRKKNWEGYLEKSIKSKK